MISPTADNAFGVREASFIVTGRHAWEMFLALINITPHAYLDPVKERQRRAAKEKLILWINRFL